MALKTLYLCCISRFSLYFFPKSPIPCLDTVVPQNYDTTQSCIFDGGQECLIKVVGHRKTFFFSQKLCTSMLLVCTTLVFLPRVVAISTMILQAFILQQKLVINPCFNSKIKSFIFNYVINTFKMRSAMATAEALEIISFV